MPPAAFSWLEGSLPPARVCLAPHCGLSFQGLMTELDDLFDQVFLLLDVKNRYQQELGST